MATILIIDDSAAHREEIKKALEGASIFDRVIEAEDGMRGLKLLLDEDLDLVLCDLEMPGLDGEKLLRINKTSARGAQVPFLFITASDNMERRARLLEDGACDAISKPFHPADLVARLRLHLKVQRLQDELRVKNESLNQLSITDEVTGLRTRRFANDFLSIEFQRALRYGSSLTVIMADLDHFKRVNDNYGHQAGDSVLQGVSSVLLSQVRGTDVAGRYGGEEIIVILAQSNCEGASTLAERWRRAIEDTVFESPDGREVRVTISIGVACFDPSMGSPEELVVAADEALYRAKNGGRNRVEIADPATSEKRSTVTRKPKR